MDLQTIVDLISSLGFPIVAVIALGFFVYKISLLYRNDCNNRIKEIESFAEKRENKFYEQLSESNEVLERFNDTLIRIDAKLESIERIMGNRQE